MKEKEVLGRKLRKQKKRENSTYMKIILMKGFVIFWVIVFIGGYASAGELKLEKGKLSLFNLSWTLYDKDKLIPAFAHLYGRGGYKGIKEIGADPSVADNLLRQAIKTGDKTSIGIAILLKILENPTKKEKPTYNSYNFCKVTLENQGDISINCIVEVGVPDYALSSKSILKLEVGKMETIELTPKFKDSLFTVTEQRPWEAYIKVTDMEGKILLERTKDILILSRNDMVWNLNSGFDMAPLITTFVTPHDKMGYINKVLRLAADRTPFRRMVGYQPLDPNKLPGQITDWQVKAVYDTLANLGMRYVNTPMSYAGQQRIKFPSQVLDDRSGNCIELSILYASIFEALDMEPVIVLVPGHAFMGVRAWHGSNSVLFLETTMTGYRSYAEAREIGNREFYSYSMKREALVIDIKKCRDLGITPVPGVSLVSGKGRNER